MTAKLYPYGNARESKAPDGSWRFTCQHGTRECLGNLLEACIMDKSRRDFARYIPVILCIETGLGQNTTQEVQECVEKDASLKWSEIESCAKGKDGNDLMHEIALRTESLDPPHWFVPWITVNGKHDQRLQSMAMQNLVGLVCSLYKGKDAPKICHAAHEEVELLDAEEELMQEQEEEEELEGQELQREDEEGEEFAWMDDVDISIV